MKLLRTLAVLILAALMLSCQAPRPNTGNPGDDDQPSESEPDFSTLALPEIDITSIAPYAYGSGSSVGSEKVIVSDETYLSYIGPDSVGYSPIVFENSNGTKVVFKNAEIKDVGDGFIFCVMQTLETVKKEPQVVYEETGEFDEEGNPIMEPVTIHVDVQRSYGNNEAVIDTNSGDVYLLMDPETYEGIFINPYDDGWTDYIVGSPEYIYVRGEEHDSTGTKGGALYRISKNTMSIDTLTNYNFIRYPWIICVSDDAVFFSSDDGNTYTLDITNHESPMVFNRNSFAIEVKYDEYNMLRFVPDPGTAFFTGEKLHMLSDSVHQDMFIDFTFRLENGEAVLDGYQAIKLPVKPETFFAMSPIVSKDNGGGDVETVLYFWSMDGATDAACLMKLQYSGDDNLAIESVEIKPEGNGENKRVFEYQNNRVYWIDGANTSASKICYVEFGTEYYHERTVMGKTIASPELNVDKNGNVTFWQYMGPTEVATFRVNPDTNNEPVLLSLSETDVHQIINIDTL